MPKNKILTNKYIFPVDKNCLVALRVDSCLKMHFRIMMRAGSVESSKKVAQCEKRAALAS